MQAVRHRIEVAAGEQMFEAAEERGIDREGVLEGAVLGTGLLDDDFAIPLENRRLDFPTCSLTSDSIDCSPPRIRVRASRTQTGQSESVVRGQPNWGRERSLLVISGAGAHRG